MHRYENEERLQLESFRNTDQFKGIKGNKRVKTHFYPRVSRIISAVCIIKGGIKCAGGGDDKSVQTF
jgi:hypothetical protein